LHVKTNETLSQNKGGVNMLFFDQKLYFPIATSYNVVPYNNELVKLQKQQLNKKNTAFISSLPVSGNLKSNHFNNKVFNKKLFHNFMNY